MVELPLVFTSWGFRSGADWWNNANELATRCINAEIKAVALQLGLNERGEENVTADEAQILRDHGLRVYVWGVTYASHAQQELRRLGASVDDWIPQIESIAQADAVIEAARQGLRAPQIVTTYSGAGDSPGEALKLKAAGVKQVLVECYAEGGNDPVHADIDRMISQGVVYGWDRSDLRPLCGTYRGEQPDAYSGLAKWGRSWGLYLAEPMSSSQWITWGAVKGLPRPTPPPPTEEPVDPITDDQARTSVKTVTQAAISSYADPKPVGRNTISWRIANAPDANWNRCRDAVKKALDAAGVPDVP